MSEQGTAPNGDDNDNFVERFAEASARWVESHRRLVIAVQVVLILGVIAAAYVILRFESVREAFEGLSYLGSFLFNAIASATVILPAPGLVLTCTFASLELNIYLLAFVSAVGSTLGESVSYFIGFTGRGLVEKRRFYGRMRGWMVSDTATTIKSSVNWTARRLRGLGAQPAPRKMRQLLAYPFRPVLWCLSYVPFGGMILFVLSFLPLPFFDLAGILAGTLRMPLYQFYIWVIPGKFFKFLLTVWVCGLGIGWLQQLFGG